MSIGRLIYFLPLGFFLLFFSNAGASHVAGADLSYKCLGGDTYQIQLHIYRDCGGIAYSSTTVAVTGVGVNCSNSTAPNLSITLSKVTSPRLNGHDTLYANSNGAYDVTPICPSLKTQTRCSGVSSYPGIELYVFRGTVVLPAACEWTFIRNIVCCRNSNLNTTSSSITAIATVNTKRRRCNVSPQFAFNAIPYLCAGKTAYVSFATTTPEADSLVYKFDCGYCNWPNVCTPLPGFSCTNPIPIPGAQLNPSTGLMTVTPTVTGNWVVIVKVEQYDRSSGQLIGFVLRDFLIVVQNCTNNYPETVCDTNSCSTQIFVNGSPTPVQTPGVIQACIGDTILIREKIYDTDTADTLMLWSNAVNLFPHATFTKTYSHGVADTVTYEVRLPNIQFQSGTRVVWVNITDEGCPFPAFLQRSFLIKVGPGVSAGEDISICRGDTVELNAVAPDSVVWTALPGGSPLRLGVNFGCETCLNTWVSPSHTTSYAIEYYDSSICKYIDTVTVFVRKDFSVAYDPLDTICHNTSTNLSFDLPDTSQQYSIQWGPASLIDSSSSNWASTNQLKDFSRISAQIENDSGCVRSAEFEVNISLPFPAQNSIFSDDTLLCNSDTVDLSLAFGSVDYGSGCSMSSGPCQGSGMDYDVVQGVSSTGSTAVPLEPNPYANAYTSVKWQFLYKANELKAKGMKAGRITGISFNVLALNNAGPFLNNFAIRIKCTSIQSLTQSFEHGLLEAKSPHTHVITSGWNKHEFENDFNWDGTSNILVEVCYSNALSSPQRTSNPTMRYDGTNYNSTNFNAGWNIDMCGIGSGYFAAPIQSLPATRFTMCEGVDPAGYNIRWASMPNGTAQFQGSASAQSTRAFVDLSTDKEFVVYLSDTSSVCFDTLYLDVDVVTKYNVKPNPRDPFCIDSGFQIVTSPTPWNILPRPGGGRWSGLGVVNDSLGLIEPALMGVGQHWIAYEVTGDQCQAKDSALFTVIGPANAYTSVGPFCELDSVNSLPGDTSFIRTYYSSAQVGVVDSANFLFNAAIAQINSNREFDLIRYVYNGCWSDTVIKVKVEAQFDATIDNIAPQCIYNDTVQLTGANGGGHWSGPGVIGPNGSFLPSLAGVGMHIIQYDSTGFCGNSDTALIWVAQARFDPIIQDPEVFYDDGGSTFTSIADITASPVGGVWGAEGTPPWMGFTLQCRFLPSAVVMANGYGKYRTWYTTEDTLAPGFACASGDTTTVFLCDVSDTAYLTQLPNGDLRANPAGLSYHWYKDSIVIGHNGRDFPNPDPTADYRVWVETANCATVWSQSSLTIGLEELSEQKIRVFPNPSHNKFLIEFEDEKDRNVSVYSILGSGIWVGQITSDRLTLDASDWEAGIYLFQVEQGTSTVSFKLIKQ